MSNYNFREALNVVKKARQQEVEIEADKFLRKVIQAISNSTVLISEEMLNEFYFTQQGCSIYVYLRYLDKPRSLNKLTESRYGYVTDAANVIRELYSKLKKEEFAIESDGIDSNGNYSFTVFTKMAEKN